MNIKSLSEKYCGHERIYFSLPAFALTGNYSLRQYFAPPTHQTAHLQTAQGQHTT